MFNNRLRVILHVFLVRHPPSPSIPPSSPAPFPSRHTPSERSSYQPPSMASKGPSPHSSRMSLITAHRVARLLGSHRRRPNHKSEPLPNAQVITSLSGVAQLSCFGTAKRAGGRASLMGLSYAHMANRLASSLSCERTTFGNNRRQ